VHIKFSTLHVTYFKLLAKMQNSSILTLLGSGHQTCMKRTNAECAVDNSWWWTEKMPETC